MEKRIDWIDFAKGFTILLVVTGHLLTAITGNSIMNHLSYISQMIIFSFVMPVFFAISGYLYKDVKNLREYTLLVYKKIASFVYPYVVFSVILIIIRYHYYSSLHIYSNPVTVFINIYRYPLEYTWFLYALLFIVLIFGLMDYLHINVYFKFIFIVILYSFTFLIKQPKFPQYSGAFVIFIFLPFFFLGYLMRRDYVNIDKIFSIKYSVVIFIFGFISMVFYYGIVFDIRGTAPNMSNINIIPRLMIVMVSFYLFNFVKEKKIFSTMGKESMIIYLIHIPVILLVLRKSSYLNPFVYISVFICMLLLSIIISFLFVKLCRYSLIKGIFYPRSWLDSLVKKTRFGKWLFSES